MFAWKWLSSRMSRKLISTYIIVVFLPIVIIGASGDYLYRTQLESNMKQTTYLAFNQLMLNMSTYLDNLDDVAELAFRDRNLHNELKHLKETGAIDTMEDLSHLEALNRKLSLFSEQFSTRVDQFGFFFASGFALRRIENYNTRLPDPTPHEIEEAIQNGMIYRSIVKIENMREIQQVSVNRGMIDLSNGDFLALFRVVDSSGELRRILDQWTDSASQLFILNDEGRVLITQSHPMIESIPGISAADWISTPFGAEGKTIQLEGKPYLLLREQLGEDVFLGCIISYDQWLQPITQLRNLLIFTGLAVLAAATGVYTVIAWNIAKPLSKLTALIRRAKGGDLKPRFYSNRTDEIGQLGDGFNAMAEEIDHLMDRVLRTQLKAKEAELQVLQNQIKPHFLQNTLESINMLAVIHNNVEVSGMVTLLGKFYRSVLQMNKKHVGIPFREELEFTKTYIAIQQIRFASKFSVEWDISEEVLDVPVLKLVLQPIVENAIVHGIEPKVGTSVLQIRCFQEQAGEDSWLVITVRDDGVGIPEHELNSIRQNLKFISDQGSVGIKNVHERIRLYYGTESGLTIDSRFGEGTEVAIRFPIIALDSRIGGELA